MVNRELVYSAARANGFGKSAMNKYIEIKKSPRFSELLKSNGRSEDQLRDEIINTQLMDLMVKKIQSEARVSDSDVLKFYEAHKDQLKHGERIKLSQIIIAAPSIDMPPLESVKTQITKTYPNLKPAEIDAKVKSIVSDQKKKAEDILTRAKQGEDFAKLANEYTDDSPEKAAKAGGDIGWWERSKLEKEFADHVWSLKTGQVCPDLITSKLGFHIMKVTGKEDPGVASFDEVKDSLREVATQNRAEQAVDDWLAQRRHQVPIVLSSQFQALIASKK
jgi:foldase protein PrsA